MKRKLVKVLERLVYWLGFDALFYWLNKKAKRIVTFHNVLPDKLWRGGLANGVSHKLSDFEKILDEIERKFAFSTDLQDAKTATITFDDGYQNQYEVAFPTLQKRGVKAFLFVAGDLTGGRGTLMIDKLLHWCENNGGAQRWIKEIWPRFLAGDSFNHELCEYQIPDGECARLRMTGIKVDDLEKMKAAGWKIGYHTKSHLPLVQFHGEALKEQLTPLFNFNSQEVI